MKTAKLEDLRRVDLLQEKEPILIEARGETVAVLYPLAVPENLPMDVKRDLFVAFASELGGALEARGITEDEILRDFAEFRERRRGR